MGAAWEASKFRVLREDRGETVPRGEDVAAAQPGIPSSPPRPPRLSERLPGASQGAGAGVGGG